VAAIESDEETEVAGGLQEDQGGDSVDPGVTEGMGPDDDDAMVDSLFADD
jgi:hypothetical protein